jgi:hypothetical protein
MELSGTVPHNVRIVLDSEADRPKVILAEKIRRALAKLNPRKGCYLAKAIPSWTGSSGSGTW